MKKAFTLLELVFVIVVIGIIAAVIIPRVGTNNLSEKTVDLISKIKYTQHLAMMDDKFDSSNPTWMRNRWQILFSASNLEYSILHNNIVNGAIGTPTHALNPQNSGDEIKNIELNGIDSVVLSDGCAGVTVISFDYLGRPFVGSLSATATSVAQYMTQKCTITLKDSSGDEAEIKIEHETGYVYRKQK